MRKVSYLSGLVVFVLACESSKDSSGNALASIASANPALVASAAAPAPAPAQEEKVVRRPGQNEVLTLTPERRARIESKHPEAAGFLVKEELEGQLYKQEIPRGKDAAALKALDKLAKGKWVLLTGVLPSPKPDSVEIAVRYTPRDPADPMGLTSQWINVTVTQVEGYDVAQYRPGETTAILAKYEGEGKASKGFDLILRDEWYIDGK